MSRARGAPRRRTHTSEPVCRWGRELGPDLPLLLLRSVAGPADDNRAHDAAAPPFERLPSTALAWQNGDVNVGRQISEQ